MASSKFFKNSSRPVIETKINGLLNKNFDLSKIERSWAIGDFLGDNFKTILGELVGEYSSSFARRSMADLAFTDKDGFYYIEFFDWECLTIGALGWDQIQIANANIVKIVPKNSRKKWMLELCDTMLEFYPKEIGKIGERIDRFKKIRKVWEKKSD